jgi:hypothetical protein
MVDYGQGPKTRRSVRLIFENCELKNEENNEPLRISRKFNLSFNINPKTGQSSNLREFLENWRDKPFTDLDFDASNPKRFSLDSLIGRVVDGKVTHKTLTNSDSGDQYAELTYVEHVKNAGYEPFHDKIAFNLEDFDQATYEKLSRGMRDEIHKSVEFARLEQEGKAKRVEDDDTGYSSSLKEAGEQGHVPAAQVASGASDDLDDDIPF